MALSARAHFALTQQIVPGTINALLNAAFAWWLHGTKDALHLWADPAYAGDLIATGFLLPSITWLILRPLLQSQARKGKAPALAGIPTPWLARWIPDRLWAGAVVIGLLGIVLVGGGTIVVLQLFGAPSFSGAGYTAFKGLYGGLFSFVLQPAMVFAALVPLLPAPAPAR